MGLFDIFKKKERLSSNSGNNILLAMPMFVNGDRYNLNAIIGYLKSYWNIDIASIEGDDDTAVVTIDGENVAIAFLPVPIPMDDIEGAAQYAYNWMTALEDIKGFSGHAIVSVMSGTKSALERFSLLSKVLHAILATSNAVGVYQGSQSLLISKAQYIDSAEDLKTNKTPIHLWVYIGVRKADTGNSIYTYGLTAFGKQEMEVIDSQISLEELYDFVSNICSYVIKSNVTFKSGETLGYTAEQKVKIKLSKGYFVEGDSLKLEM